jgi:deoxycytidylate deaminase
MYVSSKPFPYLPEGREIKYVLETDVFIKQAKKERVNSTDDSHPTGAVVVKEGLVIGKGANQSALKNKKFREFHAKYFCIRRFLKIPSGQKYWLCPGCASFRYHAESQAIKNALLKHNSLVNSDLYLYGHWWCCQPCWEKMIKAGIKNVFLVDGATEKFSR